LFILGLIGMFVVLALLSTANAQTNFGNKGHVAFGAGIFIYEHEGIPHNHCFKFSVSDGNLKRNGWYHNPNSKFYMQTTHQTKFT
jgi:hypothetical protein